MIDVNAIEEGEGYFYLNTGVPHYVIRRKIEGGLDCVDVVGEGRAIRYAERYQDIGGTNVNFIGEILTAATPLHIRIRTYERGVEDETLSCGSGSFLTQPYNHPQLPQRLKYTKVQQPLPLQRFCGS